MVGYHKAVGIKEQLLLDKSAQGYRDIYFMSAQRNLRMGVKLMVKIHVNVLSICLYYNMLW